MKRKLNKCFSEIEKLFVEADEKKKSAFNSILSEIKTIIRSDYIKKDYLTKKNRLSSFENVCYL